ncbi:MAG: hypothetical protein IID18_00450 [Nitrospinae bacterium]|nr:hypothetical protein [Nitrospinota bacterium]
MESYGQLKLNLIRKGLVIPDAVRSLAEVVCGYCDGQPGEEIALTLAENFIVKVPIREPGEDRPQLKLSGGVLMLNSNGEETEVGIVPLPNFVREQMQERSPVSENACLDGYCLNLFLRAVGQKNRLNLSRDTILSVIKSAFAEGAADLVQLNMDYCREADRGFTRLAPTVQAIKKEFSTFVALRGFPPKDQQSLDKVYAAGIDLLNLPLEGFVGSAKKADVISPPMVYSALEYAAGIFPPGTVWTELFLTPGPIDALKDKIDYLTGKGVIPLLKLLPPSIVTGEEYHRVAEVARHLEQSVQKAKLPLTWLFPHCRYLSPLDTRFFIDPPASAKLNAKPVYKSFLGRKALEGFTALRRKLRIKDVSDSYESAGL